MLDLAGQSLKVLRFDKIRVGDETVKVKQLSLKREDSNFKREMVSSIENVGDKRISTWKEC